MKEKSQLKKYKAVFIGSTFMLEECLKICSKKFKEITVITENSLLKKKYKKRFTFTKLSKIKKNTFDYLFSVINDKVIPLEILNNVSKLSLNFHDGPLPRYAGLYSSTWAILNNERYHGVCWHKIEKGIDTGDILQKSKYKLNRNDTALDVDIRGVFLGINLFSKIISKLEKKKLNGRKQNLKKRTYYGRKDFLKIQNNGFVDFQKSSKENYKLFRALNFGSKKKNIISLPKILTKNGPIVIKNFNVEKKKSLSKFRKGEIVNFKKDLLSVKCKDAIINFKLNKDIKINFNYKLLPRLTRKFCIKYAKFGLTQNYKLINDTKKINLKSTRKVISKNYKQGLIKIFKVVEKTFKTKIKLPINMWKKITFIENLGLGSLIKWDSLGHVKFLYNIEKKFNIKINAKNADKFNNLKSITNYLNS